MLFGFADLSLNNLQVLKIQKKQWKTFVYKKNNYTGYLF